MIRASNNISAAGHTKTPFLPADTRHGALIPSSRHRRPRRPTVRGLLCQLRFHHLLVLDLAARDARRERAEELVRVLRLEREHEEPVEGELAPEDELQVLDVVRLRSVVVGNATADLGYPWGQLELGCIRGEEECVRLPARVARPRRSLPQATLRRHCPSICEIW